MTPSDFTYSDSMDEFEFLQKLIERNSGKSHADPPVLLSKVADVAVDHPAKVRKGVGALSCCVNYDNGVVRKNAVRALAAVAIEYPGAVCGAVESLEVSLNDRYDPVRRNASLALARVAKVHPGDVSSTIGTLQVCLDNDDDKIVRQNTTAAILQTAIEYPREVRGAVDILKNHLNDDHDPVRENSTWALAEVAAEHPRDVRDAVEALHTCIDDDHDTVRENATWAIALVAVEFPEDVREAVDALQAHLTDDHDPVRGNASITLAQVAVDYPGDVREAVDNLQARLEEDDDIVREYAADALAGVAVEYPEDVRESVSTLEARLDDNNNRTRLCAADALAAVAEKHPGDVRTAVTSLRARLNDEDDLVRGSAVMALAKMDEYYPEAVRGAIDIFQAHLDEDDGAIRSDAVSGLAVVAEEYPEEVGEVVDSLQSCLTDNHDPVRSNAVEALSAVAGEHPEDVQSAVAELANILQDENDDTRSNALKILRAVAEDSPAAVKPVIRDIGKCLTDDPVAVEATDTLTVLATSYPEQVRETVRTQAPKKVSAIFGDSTGQSSEQTAPSGQPMAAGHSQSRREIRSKVPDEVPNTPTVDIDYHALDKGEPLGSGGNADVYQASVETASGSTEVALKEPRMNGTLHTELLDCLLEEAETWDKLDDHEQIVTVLDYGSTPLPWIAMEYMDGGHLGQRAGELGFEQTVWTAIETTKGIRHAHRRGVAHLDLKPENILFKQVEDGWDIPKVADWGLSKQLLDHSKSIGGMSPQYAAPEQFTDDLGTPDDITDIYQLGTVFYELFTGRPPYDGRPLKVMHQIQNEEPTPPSEVAPVPEKLDDILLQALATEREDRYEAVIYFRDDLQELLKSF